MTEAVEAVKCALRQTKDGTVVSFTLHPSDDADHLITMPIGQRVMLAVQPFIESESDPRHRSVEKAGDNSAAALPGARLATAAPTPSGLPPPLPPAAPEGRQQSPGSGDAREAPPTHISENGPSVADVSAHAASGTVKTTADPSGKNVRRTPFHQKPLSQQAAILCRDVAFQLWASAHLEGDPVREPKSCEIWLKRKLGIVSFTELDNVGIKFSNYPMRTFRELVEDFEKSVGRIPA